MLFNDSVRIYIKLRGKRLQFVLCKKLSIMAIKYTVFGDSTSEEKASRLYIIIEGRVYKSMILAI